MSLVIAHPEALATAAGHLNWCWVRIDAAECGRGDCDDRVAAGNRR
jgi:hypothetical protein